MPSISSTATADAPPWAVDRLLRELMAERRLTLEELERRLEWAPGRLAGLLEGRRAVGFAELWPVLEQLELHPAGFLARFHGIAADPGRSATVDARFEESRKALREAMRRRSTGGRSGAGRG